MRRMSAIGIAAVVALGLAASPMRADAALLFDFSYTGTGSNVAGASIGPINVAGQFTTTDTAIGGFYTVLGITGTRNGIPITALAATGALGGNDNLISLASPFVDNNGISYIDGAVTYNFYLSGGEGACAGVLEISTPNPGIECQTEAPVTFAVTQAAAAPEPASLALLGGGLLGLHLVRRREAR